MKNNVSYSCFKFYILNKKIKVYKFRSASLSKKMYLINGKHSYFLKLNFLHNINNVTVC